MTTWRTPGTVDYAVREAVLNAIMTQGGDMAKAARHLAIGRSTLYRWLKQLDIPYMGRERECARKRDARLRQEDLERRARVKPASIAVVVPGGVAFVPREGRV